MGALPPELLPAPRDKGEHLLVVECDVGSPDLGWDHVDVLYLLIILRVPSQVSVHPVLQPSDNTVINLLNKIII